MPVEPDLKHISDNILLAYIEDIKKAKNISTYRLLKLAGIYPGYVQALKTGRRRNSTSIYILIHLIRVSGVQFNSANYLHLINQVIEPDKGK